jgi:hypothetical protein
LAFHITGVFENRVLRKTFGPKTDEVTENWRKLHTEELHDVYSSPDITRVIESQARHVPCMGKRDNHRALYGKIRRGGGALEDPRVDGSTLLKQISTEWDGRTYTKIHLAKDGTLMAGLL